MATKFGFQQSAFVLAAEPAGWPTAITVAEVNAGVRIEEDLPGPLNFSGTTNFADTSVTASRQDRREVGTFTPDEITFEVWNRKVPTVNIAIPALDDETNYWLVKFEGGNIAAGDHGAVAIGDTCDAIAVTVGTKSDVDTPRGDPRRMSVPVGVNDTIVRDLDLT